MRFSIRRVSTLVIKETKDLIKNMNVFLMCLLPLVFAVFYSKMSPTFNQLSLSMFFIMNSCMIAPMTMAMLIAEEKEKNTLRTLMLSTVSPLEFLVGKAIVTWVLLGITNIGIFYVLGVETKYLLYYVIIAILLSTTMILMGAIVGLFSKNQMSSGTNSIPILLLFYLIPALGKSNETLKIIANLLPTYHSELVINKLLNNENLLVTGKEHFIVLLIWIVLALVAFGMIYKRKRLDD